MSETLEDRSTFPIGNVIFYVCSPVENEGTTSYQVGTLNTSESPIPIRLLGRDSMPLRFEAAKAGYNRLVSEQIET